MGDPGGALLCTPRPAVPCAGPCLSPGGSVPGARAGGPVAPCGGVRERRVGGENCACARGGDTSRARGPTGDPSCPPGVRKHRAGPDARVLVSGLPAAMGGKATETHAKFMIKEVAACRLRRGSAKGNGGSVSQDKPTTYLFPRRRDTQDTENICAPQGSPSRNGADAWAHAVSELMSPPQMAAWGRLPSLLCDGSPASFHSDVHSLLIYR